MMHCVFLSLKIVFNFAYCADPDEMLFYAAAMIPSESSLFTKVPGPKL